jgi:hypothetical protein
MKLKIKSVIKATVKKPLELSRQKFIQKLLSNVLTNEQLMAHNSGCSWLKTDEVERVILSSPALTPVTNVPQEIIEKTGEFIFRKSFVCETKNVVLLGASALALHKGRPVLENSVARIDCLKSSIEHASLHFYLFGKFTKHKLIIKDEAVCNLVSNWSNNYFHWTLECLTRLRDLDVYKKTTGKSVKLLINNHPPKWMLDSLHLLGYSDKDIVQYNTPHMEIETLVIPSFKREGGRTSPMACKWLKEQLFNVVSNEIHTPKKKIYISRSKASSRKIINENEFVEKITDLGFETYYLENLSFSEQVILFAQAEVVVAPHGAGLTNIVYSDSNAIIFEIFADNYINPCFYTLASGLGQTYSFHIGKCHQNNIELDTEVVIAKLKNLLQKS